MDDPNVATSGPVPEHVAAQPFALGNASARDPGILIQEYAALVAKMGSNESWSYSFVGLYFAFIASLGTAAGFIIFKFQDLGIEPAANSAVAVDGFAPGLEWLLPRLLLVLGIIALLLNAWGWAMVVEYRSTTAITLFRMKNIEHALTAPSIPDDRFATRILGKDKVFFWWLGRQIFGWTIPLFFSVPWVFVILFALGHI